MPIVGPAVELPFSPTLGDVHAHLPTRPIFSTSSRPSINDVQAMIDLASAGLNAEFPALTDTLIPIARAYLTYRIAAQVEWSYDPEQQFNGDQAMAPHLDQAAGAEYARLKRLSAERDGTVTQGFSIMPAHQGYIVTPGAPVVLT